MPTALFGRRCSRAGLPGRTWGRVSPGNPGAPRTSVVGLPGQALIGRWAETVAPGMTDRVVFFVAGEACQVHSVSLYVDSGPYPESHAVSTQPVTVCGGAQKMVTFTVTNTF